MKNLDKIQTTSIRLSALRRAKIASSLIGESLTDFISKASDGESARIIHKHGVKLPSHLSQQRDSGSVKD